MTQPAPDWFTRLYAEFDPPLSTLDCGERCGPYNYDRAPFCCDARHAVPTAYLAEWEYLKSQTDLWHPWCGQDEAETRQIQEQTPAGQILIECRGYRHCQRAYRSLTCRAFPFFPYVSQLGEFLGLSYYWEYEDRCWVLSHLDTVSNVYREAFIKTYEQIFAAMPQERENFRYHAMIMRRVFGRRKQLIPLLHRDGSWYTVATRGEQLTPLHIDELPRHGVYAIAAEMPFASE